MVAGSQDREYKSKPKTVYLLVKQVKVLRRKRKQKKKIKTLRVGRKWWKIHL